MSALHRVLDAPNLRDDFYCSVLAYSPTCHTLAVALGNMLYAWSETDGVTPLNAGLGPGGSDGSTYITSVAFSSGEGGRSILAVGRSNGMLAMLSLYDSLVPRLEFNNACPVACLGWRPTCTVRPSASPNNPDVPVATEDLLVGDDAGYVDYYVVEWPAAWEVARDGWPGCMTLIARIAVHSQQICGLAWSPDGTMFASGGNDNLCCLFYVDSVLTAESEPDPESESVSGPNRPYVSKNSAPTDVTGSVADAMARATAAASSSAMTSPRSHERTVAFHSHTGVTAGFRVGASPPMRLSTLFDLGDSRRELDAVHMAGTDLSTSDTVGPGTPGTSPTRSTETPPTAAGSHATTTTGSPSWTTTAPTTPPTSPRRTIRVLPNGPRHLPAGSELHRLVHGAAVKAIAWCPWLSGLVATGGGSNDRCIHFYHARSGTALATIAVSAQVTALVWSRRRREIAATFGYASPDHAVRIAVFAWPGCTQVAAVPWDAVGELRALSAVAYPLTVVGGPAGGSRERRRPGRTDGVGGGTRLVEDGCIVVAASDESIKFHEVWPEEGDEGYAATMVDMLGGDVEEAGIFDDDYDIDDDGEVVDGQIRRATARARARARTTKTTTGTVSRVTHLGAAGVGMLGGSDILEDLEGIEKEGDIIR